MRNLLELPDDILIPTISACDIDTFFSLRLSCKSFLIITDIYIKTIAPGVARTTYPGCDVLLTPPETGTGYSLRWLRSRVPAQLASIMLDKDKLRRHPYINSGFPYGIPSESSCDEANHWRGRIADGWRVLRSLSLISEQVYKKSESDLERPNALRRVSSGMRSNRLWQTVSCPYSSCTEHGIKHIFDGRPRRGSGNYHVESKEAIVERVRRRETIVLRRRLAFIQGLPNEDLVSYVYLWRLLFWTFRPYCEPGTIDWDDLQHLKSGSQTNWSAMINDITQGCSWINWFVLSVGPSPFLKQWCHTSTLGNKAQNPNCLRDMILKAYASRSPHQTEIEREYVSKFEFALRKRCLSGDRLKRLEAEINDGRSIRTISLDCIPWSYDQHPVIARPPSDFPWYKPGQCIWLHGDWALQTRPGTIWARPGMLKLSLRWRGRVFEQGSRADSATGEEEDEIKDDEKGPLQNVPYLVYLGIEEPDRVWASRASDALELAF